MKKSASSEYVAPCAVRLSDAMTGGYRCTNGRYGTAEFCVEGYKVNPNNVCEIGSMVREQESR